MAVENICGYTIDLAAMTPCSRSMVGFATKDGVTYQCRKYLVSAPRSGETGADAFGMQKDRVYTQLRTTFGADPGVQLPGECVNHGGDWFVFSEWPDDGVLPEKRPGVVGAMSAEARIALIAATARTLGDLHRYNIVHGSLTAESIMPVLREGQLPAARLTGLEDAFPEGVAPDGRPDEALPYAAPELGAAGSGSAGQTITTKADIFSLGLILHEFLAGCAPAPDALPPELQQQRDRGMTIFPWQVLTAVLPDGSRPQLVVSPEIREPALVALISDMLHPNPSRRPKPDSVVRRLGSEALPIESKTWPGDGITINPEIAGQRVIGLRKYARSRKSGEAEQLYEIIHGDGRRAVVSSRQLIGLGIASILEIVDSPWPADKIRWDEERLKTMFACVRRGPKPGLYQMTDNAGNSRQCTASQLKMLRFAVPKRGELRSAEEIRPLRPKRGVGPDGLWEEDRQLRLRVNPGEAASLGLLFDGAAELCGIRGYQFTNRSGDSRFISRTGCRLLNILVPE